MKKLKLIRLSFVALLLFSVELSAQTQYLSPTSTIRFVTMPRLIAKVMSVIKNVAYGNDMLVTLCKDLQSDDCYFVRTIENSKTVDYSCLPKI